MIADVDVALAKDEPPPWWTSDEWSTPRRLLRELSASFGPFNLDPCCRPETACASRFYTKEDDGLRNPWHGRVFCNPPYSDPAPWIERGIAEVNRHHAERVVFLLPAATDTAWFHELLLGRADLKFLRGRVRFIGWKGTPIRSPKTASMVAVVNQLSKQESKP